MACEAVRERLFEMTSEEFGEEPGEPLPRGRQRCVRQTGDRLAGRADRDEEIEETVEHHHRRRTRWTRRDRGTRTLQFAFAAHRAVVEVDTELGLVRVVEIATRRT
jgi:CO/xanthine dehydrogenase Mo-binding subunit